VEDRRELLF